MLSLDWPKLLRDNSRDWRAVQMAIAQVHHDRGITLSDLQDLPVRQVWDQTPKAEKALALIRSVEPLASFGNLEAAQLIRTLDPKKFSREIPAERDLFQALGILGEYGVGRTADVLAPFAEGDPVALAYLVRMAHYGDKIAYNLMHSLRVGDLEAVARKDLNALFSLIVLNRQGHRGAQRALERLFGKKPVLESMAEEEMGFESPDTRMESPKYNLHQVCEFYLDRFSSLSEAEKVRMVNHIWQTWQGLSPQARVTYFERDRNGAFSNKIPISFIEETFMTQVTE